MHIHCMCIYQSMHKHVYVRERTSTNTRASTHTIEIFVGALCAHVHAPLVDRPRIKMASFYVYCNELHDLPQRYVGGEKRSLDVRAHI